MPSLSRIASRHGLALVEDCCQAHLATCDGRPVGTIGIAGAFSFYPTKNLGTLGDGGAVVTNDDALAARIRRLRNGGQTSRYQHMEAGINSRLDEMHAAILRARLPRLSAWTARRRALAARYRQLLAEATVIDVPEERDPGHVYHLFVVRALDTVAVRQPDETPRAALQASLAACGVETLVHYPVPIPRQPALRATDPAGCPVAARVCEEVLSLPLYPGLALNDIDVVAAALSSASAHVSQRTE
jgi:dTDP-3-amino-3,4,6-trideoxy-alpha-D-glucose transaminase